MKGPDQDVLKKYVWIWAKHSSVQHDSYLCKVFKGSRAYPTERKNEPNNYIAAVSIDNETLWKKCPIQCRPRNHPEWEHC